jgi:NifU-like protein involved in Fe-S cluster formation
VDIAASMKSSDVLDMLGIEISPARMKCAMLSLETLQGALVPTVAAAPAAPVDA